MRNQKKQTSALRTEWRQMLADGRVVRWDAYRMTGYPTHAAMQVALAEAGALAAMAEVVCISLADQARRGQ